MATLATKLYASQENGFKADVSIQEIASLIGGAVTIPNATTSTAGVVKQSAAQADSEATDVAGLVSDYNDLLAALRTAGILAAS